MVNEKVLVKDKLRKVKKFTKILLIIFLVFLLILMIFLFGFLTKKPENKTTIILENPLKNIVFLHTNEQGKVNKSAVVEQAVIEFNADYINYLLIALGVNNLHKSLIGYGNPIVEMSLDNEIWNSEIKEDGLYTRKASAEKKDLKITLSKQEAVEALLSPDIKQFMKDSVISGKTQIEMIAGKIELGSKGYLAMYKKITGEEIEIEE